MNASKVVLSLTILGVIFLITLSCSYQENKQKKREEHNKIILDAMNQMHELKELHKMDQIPQTNFNEYD